MWKRIQQNKSGRAQEGTISSRRDSIPEGIEYGGPRSIPATMDGIPQSNNSTERPVRPPREPPKGLPSLPFQPAQPAPQPGGNRPPSSIYSQPSPNPQTSHLPRMNSVARAYDEQVEISPPSSPETFAADSRQRRSANGGVVSPDISPVDETPDLSQLQINQSSSRSGQRTAAKHIPVLRREKRRNQIGLAAANLLSRKDESYGDGIKNKKTADTRWDTLTGEPTTSLVGRPRQVKPSEFSPPGNSIYDIAEDRGLGLQTTSIVVPKPQISFGERARKIKESHMTIGARSERNSSGSPSEIFPPGEGQLNLKTIDIPRKSSKRATSPRVAGSGSSTPVSVILSSAAETSVVSPTPSAYAVPRIMPLAPAREGKESPPRYLTSPSSLIPQPLSFATQSNRSPAVSDRELAIQHNSPLSAAPTRGNSLPTTTDSENLTPKRENSTTSIERNFREALKNINFPPASREQPVSRFSVTTYATSTATSTPRVSSESPPPMPTPPTETTPIVNRRRPKVSTSFDSSKAIARKAVPGSPVFISMSNSIASRRNSKMLPKSPPEQQSVDLISSLQAQLDNLAHRRVNLQKSIRQMTELMPTDVLARGMEARRQREEKEKVELLREDLADVVREEHDLGLRLHRALKRRDQNAVYEPTGLWVRRVTG